MGQEITPPKRAIEIKLKLGADTIEEAISALEHIALEFSMGKINGPTCISGGPSSGYILEIKKKPEITPDIYQKNLKDYLKGRGSIFGA